MGDKGTQSWTYNGLIYTTNDSGALNINVVNEGDIASGADLALGYRSSVPNATTQISFRTADGTEFKLNSFVLSIGLGDTTVTIKGYRDSTEVASTSATTASFTTVDVSANAAWENIDEVRMTSADLDIDIDDLSLSAPVLPTYSVTYNGNSNTGGAAPADGTSYYNGDPVTVLANTGSLVRTGYTFAGWNTIANGSGTSYTGGDTFAIGTSDVTLYAQWTAVDYSVTYNGNTNTGGAVPTDGNTYNITDTVTVLGNTGTLVKTGYTFAGWNTAANGSGTSYNGTDTFAMGSSSVTLYAQWTENTYSVTYNGNSNTGGAVPTDATSYYNGDPVTVLANTGSLVRTGYTFAGWNTAANGSGTAYTGGDTFAIGTSDVTLYAQWTAVDYSVTYNGNTHTGGAVPTDGNTYHITQTVTVLGNTGSLVKTHHLFTGWNTAADGSGTPYSPDDTFAMGSSSVTLYAQWEFNLPIGTTQFTATAPALDTPVGNFAMQFETGVIPSDASVELSFTVTANSSDDNRDLIHCGDQPLVGLGNAYPIYSPLLPASVSYDISSCAAGHNLGTEERIFSANAWTDPMGRDDFVYGTLSFSSITLSVTVPAYSVTYSGNGHTGGAVPVDATQYRPGNSATVLGNSGALIRTGHTFLGWNTAADGSGTSYSEGDTLNIGTNSITLYAHWSPNNYTLTFDSNGGSAIAPMTQAYGTAVTAPSNPARTGYTFAGWSPALPATMPATNQTHTAQWSVNSYTLTFDSNGGSTIAPITQAYGTAVTAPSNPARTGYTFAGWSPALPATMPAANQTHTAQWSLNSYTLTFDSAGGSAVAAITQAYGSAVTAPANPTRTGYTFTGWSPSVPATMPAASQTHTAQWTANNYTLTFDSAGGSAVAPITQAYDSAVVAPADPTREGYTFTGWGPSVPATMPAASQTHTAQWTANNYTLTYLAGTGGSIQGDTPQQVEYQTNGSAVTAQADAGYQFVEWSDARTDNPRQDLTITEDLSVEARFVTLHTIGGTLNGLADGELVLDLNGGIDRLTLTAEGGFTFTQPLLYGSSYAVVILQQPEGYACSITRGRGTVSADVTGVVVGCLAVEDDRPQVAFSSTRQFGTSGEEVVIQAILEGTPKQYPIHVAYQISGASLIGSSDPELQASGELTFLAEHERVRTLRLTPSAQSGEIVITLLAREGEDSAKIGNPYQHTVALFAPETVPMIGSITLLQGGIAPAEPNVVIPGQGEVSLEVSVDTPTTFDWSASAAALGIGTQTGARVTLPTPWPVDGHYPVKVTLLETGGQRTLTLQLDLRIASAIPDDYYQFYDDVYQEEPHRLPICPGGTFRVGTCEGEEAPVYLDVPEGLSVTLGVQSESASWNSNDFALSIEPDDLKDDTGSPAENRHDERFTHLGYLVDFEIKGLDLPGQSVPLVIPLPTGQTIPRLALWRKYLGPSRGWQDFVQDQANQLFSASRNALGNCPWPGSDSWQPGLNQGDACVRLIIEDGGPNDLDGAMDGVIRDPGTLAVSVSEAVSVRSKGGSLGLVLLGLLGVGIGGWLRRFRGLGGRAWRTW
jgi:uncharacterized repeat protein (TIGR02543 family)